MPQKPADKSRERRKTLAGRKDIRPEGEKNVRRRGRKDRAARDERTYSNGKQAAKKKKRNE